MRLGREAATVSIAALWVGAWALWLAAGAILPVPPWQARGVLAREERLAMALSVPRQAEAWSIDVGSSRQSGALGAGWSDDEAFIDEGRRRTFVWIEGASAGVAFATPGWPEAHVTLRASPLRILAPLSVDVELDGERRVSIVAREGWTVAHAPLGPVGPGPHVLSLRPHRQERPPGELRTLSLAVAGLAVGPAPVDEPDADRGVFQGWLRAGLHERPAVFVSTDAATGSLPEGTLRHAVSPELTALYGFGVGGASSRATPVVEALHGLLTGALVTLIPGLCWTGLLGCRGAARLAAALGLSTFALVTVFVALRLAGIHPTSPAVAAGLALVALPPVLVLGRREILSVPWSAVGLAVVTASTLTYFAGAVVPPLEDQDMDAQCTVYALATRLVPETLTNRGTTYFFAHPPLLHLWQAGSFALTGQLDRVEYYAAAARRAASRAFVEPAPHAPLAARPHFEEWRALRRRFLSEPRLWPTRQVNVLLAALAVGLLAHLAASLSGSRWAGIGLAAAFVTLPEFLIRGAYGGDFAASTLLTLLILAGIAARAAAPSVLTSSGLAFLTDQKGLLAPLAWALAAPAKAGRRRFLPLAGSLFAVAIYTVYGLGVDSPAFMYDFVKEHVLRRLVLSDVRFVADPSRWYPSIPELWQEFASRYGAVFTLWAAAAAALGLRSDRDASRAASASVLLGALVFSLTDWRQTKHLALLAGPALVAMAGAWPGSPRARRIAFALVGLVVLRNLRAAWPLLSSFEALRPSTIW